MDVVVHCSVAPEPFGRVLVEAMLAGKPVVASAAGGVMEIVEDGVTGFLVPPGDVAALAAVLTRVLESAPDITTGTEAGREKARQHFSVKASIQQVENALMEFEF